MAELLVRVRDKEGHNPWLLGEHEVVVVCNDGWRWSRIEMTHADWRIVAMPGVSRLDALRFAQPEIMADPEWEVVRRRQVKLDPSKFPADFAAWYADDSRVQPIRFVVEREFESWFRVRTPIQRRDVIGARPRRVIG